MRRQLHAGQAPCRPHRGVRQAPPAAAECAVAADRRRPAAQGSHRRRSMPWAWATPSACWATGPDIENVLPLLDAAVLASSTEGMSNAILEAMSCGLPMVATAVGGNLQLVEPGVNGLLVPACDPEALAAALVRTGGVRRAAHHGSGKPAANASCANFRSMAWSGPTTAFTTACWGAREQPAALGPAGSIQCRPVRRRPHGLDAESRPRRAGRAQPSAQHQQLPDARASPARSGDDTGAGCRLAALPGTFRPAHRPRP